MEVSTRSLPWDQHPAHIAHLCELGSFHLYKGASQLCQPPGYLGLAHSVGPTISIFLGLISPAYPPAKSSPIPVPQDTARPLGFILTYYVFVKLLHYLEGLAPSPFTSPFTIAPVLLYRHWCIHIFGTLFQGFLCYITGTKPGVLVQRPCRRQRIGSSRPHAITSSSGSITSPYRNHKQGLAV